MPRGRHQRSASAQHSRGAAPKRSGGRRVGRGSLGNVSPGNTAGAGVLSCLPWAAHHLDGSKFLWAKSLRGHAGPRVLELCGKPFEPLVVDVGIQVAVGVRSQSPVHPVYIIARGSAYVCCELVVRHEKQQLWRQWKNDFGCPVDKASIPVKWAHRFWVYFSNQRIISSDEKAVCRV
jgi:hypothetical protein